MIWTLGHMAHGLASGVVSFAMARFLLGVGEAGNYPAGIRAVADWPSTSTCRTAWRYAATKAAPGGA